ncbi:MAG TPA: hypothetical protein VKW08_18990 [Xanthobacteraceae bacterium]|jgi:hypothetical protein|nr:hypothetical protein [Xanthobacteraceae bacterium]
MTDLTPQQILDAIERGLEETARRLKFDKTFPKDGRMYPLPPQLEGAERKPHPRRTD